MNAKIQRWLKTGLFPLLNAVIYAVLFYLTESFISRDPNKLIDWSLAGFAIGLAAGVAIQLTLWRWEKPVVKPLIFGGLLLLQLFIGLFLLGPFTWISLRYIPTSNIHSICCDTPKDYGAADYENVHITTDDGASISGWYVAPGSQAGKVIILIHGYGSDRRATDFQTRILIAAGYGVLLYDLRDHGESVGKLNLFNRMEVNQADLLQVVNFVKQKPAVNPAHIGVIGISLGAFSTLNLPIETLNSFAGLWLDGLNGENFSARVPPHSSPYAYAASIFVQQAERLAVRYYQHTMTGDTPLFSEIIPQITHPQVMIVASGLDQRERETNEGFIPLMGGNKQIWFIANAWHVGGRYDAPDEYRSKLLAFFAEAMKD